MTCRGAQAALQRAGPRLLKEREHDGVAAVCIPWLGIMTPGGLCCTGRHFTCLKSVKNGGVAADAAVKTPKP